MKTLFSAIIILSILASTLLLFAGIADIWNLLDAKLITQLAQTSGLGLIVAIILLFIWLIKKIQQ